MLRLIHIVLRGIRMTRREYGGNRENYNDLYLFMRVVREEQFYRRSVTTGLAQSGVNRAVRELEERLGVQLLGAHHPPVVAHSRRVAALSQCRIRFRRLRYGTRYAGLHRQTPSGTVRINASQHAIDKVLLPKLAVFKQRYPDIRL